MSIRWPCYCTVHDVYVVIRWPCYCTVHDVYVVIRWPCYCTVHDVYVVIRWPCYCTVHDVHVVIHICDTMWSCWVDPNLCRLCCWRSNYQEGGIPLTYLTTPHFCSFPKPGSGFPRSYVAVFFYVQWVNVRSDCLLSWHWRNCWPSLVCKLCFHITKKEITVYIYMYLKLIIQLDWQ